MENLSLQRQLFLHTLAGGTSGLLVEVFCYPLETIKTRLQVSSKVDPQVKLRESDAEPVQGLRLLNPRIRPFLCVFFLGVRINQAVPRFPESHVLGEMKSRAPLSRRCWEELEPRF